MTLDHSIFGTGITVWHEIFSGVYFCGLADFCVLCELIFAIRTDWFSESTQYLELMISSFLSSTDFLPEKGHLEFSEPFFWLKFSKR